MTIYGIDYGWASGTLHPEVWYRDGYRYVGRYLSHNPTKDITARELAVITGGGLGVYLLWETTANRMRDGYTAGQADAIEAYRRSRALGKPDGAPIYFCCDWPYDFATIEPYMVGVLGSMPRGEVGIYGGYLTVAGSLDKIGVKWGFQAAAWTNGKIDGRAAIHQNGQQYTGGGVYRADVDWSLFSVNGAWAPGKPWPYTVGSGTPNPNTPPPPQGATTWAWDALVLESAYAVASKHGSLSSSVSAINNLMVNGS